ncbi:MAG: O-antigen ligase family protein, partial [Hyphomicrobium sp.]
MVLVVLTDRRPYEAMAALLRRLAFLTLPLSALFIKYYPGLARDYRPGGGVMYTGIGHQKNDLGLLCLLAGLYLLWELLRRDDGRQPNFARENRLVAIILGMLMLWLLNMSDSKTPVVCLTAATILLTMGRLPFVARQPGWLIGATIASVPLVWILNNSQVKEFIFSLIGRDASLTNRTEVWELVGQFSGNPIVGVGFMSFWSGERIDEIWRQLGVQINQAHNGYIEQYLNLGIVGVGFIIGIMLFALLHIAREMKLDPGTNMLRLSIVAAAVLYNITEASFYGTNNMWVLFLLGVIQPPLAGQSVPSAAPAARARVAARGLGALRPQALFARRLDGANTASRLRFKRQSQPSRSPQPA